MDEEAREHIQRVAGSDLPAAKWAQALLILEFRKEHREGGIEVDSEDGTTREGIA